MFWKARDGSGLLAILLTTTMVHTPYFGRLSKAVKKVAKTCPSYYTIKDGSRGGMWDMLRMQWWQVTFKKELVTVTSYFAKKVT